MAYVKKDQAPALEMQRVLVKMTSRNAKAVERVVAELLEHARTEKVEVRGPVRLPTRRLRITTRKTPCGNGTNTWDTFEMKIYKRLVDLRASTELVKKITSFQIEAGVDVSITIPDDQ
ncbi:Ribosomal protein S10p/S20e [Trypanosoma brucei equiperdum]|uniref:Small ribosomal subunit protein uS10 n=1 Tax=Trypanosoma brucei equiperdum TaxID=630700 RepID=A0A3L6KWF3_9TRYP|nr:Ribosomal protein S10p/S20e [Trypanosoma brucei equiperdum]8OVA_AQ Chain AQ, Ribosomal protein S10 [Trypanosoma brucei brucei]8OVE_AQ Chain AQ, Ribosomal protein S10 [Trypanosoma brucei brucei]